MVFLIFLIIVIGGALMIGFLVDRHDTKKEQLQVQPPPPKQPNMVELRESYFNSAVNLIIKTMYQNNFSGWEYAENIGELKSENQYNRIIVYLKNGSTTDVKLSREQVFAKMGIPLYSASCEDTRDTRTPTADPIQQWMDEYLDDIIAKVTKSKSKGYSSILYPFGSEYMSVSGQIAEEIEKATGFSVSVDFEASRLKINF